MIVYKSSKAVVDLWLQLLMAKVLLNKNMVKRAASCVISSGTQVIEADLCDLHPYDSPGHIITSTPSQLPIMR